MADYYLPVLGMTVLLYWVYFQKKTLVGYASHFTSCNVDNQLSYSDVVLRSFEEFNKQSIKTRVRNFRIRFMLFYYMPWS